MAAPGQEEEMTGECVLVEKSEGVAILTMNRPEQLNAMSHQLSAELHDAVMRMSADDEVGCIVITGAGDPAIGGSQEAEARMLASSLDMRVGCEHASFRFLAAAYGRINSTWTLPNQVGWPIAKELLFSGRVVEA